MTTPPETGASTRTVRIRDVAALAGVASSTVSNVLNRPEIVAPATRSRVEAAIQSLGFVPNASARHLRRGRGTVLGLVLLDVSNPFFIDVSRGVEDAARAAGMAVIFCNSNEELAREREYLQLLEAQRVAGVVITPVSDDETRLRRLRQRGIPVVLLDQLAHHHDLCSVSVDHRLGGELAVRHLLEQGHRRIAFLGGPWQLAQVRDRYQGAQAALEQAGLPATELWHIPVPGPPARPVGVGRDAVARLMGVPRPQRPTAVFCASDRVALGMLQGLTQQGLRSPDDVALVGYDDIEFAGAAAVPLSSVRQPRYELGRTAAQLLIEEAEHPTVHTHQRIQFPPELVVRDSSVGVPVRGAARSALVQVSSLSRAARG